MVGQVFRCYVTEATQPFCEPAVASQASMLLRCRSGADGWPVCRVPSCWLTPARRRHRVPRNGRGRQLVRRRCDDTHQPLSAKDLALGLPAKAWRRVTWREGTNTRQACRFAAMRVRSAQGGPSRCESCAEEWAGRRSLCPPRQEGQAPVADRARLPGP
jgi:hypothetical protein